MATAMSDAVVYVVDDNPALCRALCRLLQAAGFDARAFGSGEEFLAHAHHEGPGCVILDVRMPGFSGLTLQARLGDLQQTLPIIFLTGHGSVSTTVRAMKGGALDVLEKPADTEELLAAVRRAVALSRERSAARAARADIEHRLQTLTPRERQVLELVVRGLLNRQIAAQLGTAEKTIKIHRGRVMQKMQARSIADLVHMAARVNLATGSDATRS